MKNISTKQNGRRYWNPIVEASATYKALPYIVLGVQGAGYRLSYVGVPELLMRQWYQKALEDSGADATSAPSEVDDIMAEGDIINSAFWQYIECHGGITYNNSASRMRHSDGTEHLWSAFDDHYILGFDTNHLNDAPDPDLLDTEEFEVDVDPYIIGTTKLWTTDMCVAECESMIDQIWQVGSPDELEGDIRYLKYKDALKSNALDGIEA